MTSPPPLPSGSPIRLGALLFSFYPVSSYEASVSPFNPYCSSRSFSPASFGNSSVSTSWSCCCFPSPLCPSSVLLLSLVFSFVCPFRPFFHPSLAFFLLLLFLSRKPPLTHYQTGSLFLSDPRGLTTTSPPLSLSLSFTLFGDMEESQIPKSSLSEGDQIPGTPSPSLWFSPSLDLGRPIQLVCIVPLPPPPPHVFHHIDSNNTMQDSASVGKPETVSNPSKNNSCVCWSEPSTNTTGQRKEIAAKILNEKITTPFQTCP